MSRTTLWFATLAAFASSVYLLMSKALIAGSLLLCTSALCGGIAETRMMRQSRRRAYEEKYGASLERVRASVDTRALLRMREERGDVHAARLLRRQAPQVPLKEAVKLIRSL